MTVQFPSVGGLMRLYKLKVLQSCKNISIDGWSFWHLATHVLPTKGSMESWFILLVSTWLELWDCNSSKQRSFVDYSVNLGPPLILLVRNMSFVISPICSSSSQLSNHHITSSQPTTKIIEEVIQREGKFPCWVTVKEPIDAAILILLHGYPRGLAEKLRSQFNSGLSQVAWVGVRLCHFWTGPQSSRIAFIRFIHHLRPGDCIL